MNRIFNTIRRILANLAGSQISVDPISALSPRDYADLPVYHPRLDN